MIFYFSGTGNSLFIAKEIAKAQGDATESIAHALDKSNLTYELKDGALLGFVYPVYSWAPPQIVLEFIQNMTVTGGKPYVFSVNTCGDEEGHATRTLQKALESKVMKLNSAFSVRMPNNYILGFDVDSKALEEEKLRQSGRKLMQINDVIAKRDSAFDLLPGRLPSVKSGLIAPLFNRFARATSKFYALDTCTRCGLCVELCPVHTITLSDKPKWDKSCTRCLACIHRCPVRAIQYGTATVKKGRYIHPVLRGRSSDAMPND